ncbi:multicilin isoform X1 [Cyprinodon tularosa]|uniref:multicilin isoform X1 n=1 Tax=Cyprinodon tularosa TaxID=77115 RepID=UPI0018E22174|nr:multicilin isoform X1 [Cyprinodon tularosa]
MMEMQKETNTNGAAWPNRLGQRGRRITDKTPVPRSSSPVDLYVEFPCIADQALATIEWEDLEDCASAGRQERNSFSFQVNGSDPDEQHYRDALDFIADSSEMGESCLSELIPFQGCVIPPLTPQRDFSPEEHMVHSLTKSTQNAISWRGIAECHGRALEDSMTINKQLQETLDRRQKELDSLEERNLDLKQLASRAKHLASVLDRLMTVRDSHAEELALPCDENTSLSPCKRQRLDEGYETESSDSVEDMLKDISTRCNAVLLSSTAGALQESDTIPMYGAFSSFQMSTPKGRTVNVDVVEDAEDVSSFRTPVREHCTIRTQVFPHGHVFTSRTHQGGYRFRWVPNHC